MLPSLEVRGGKHGTRGAAGASLPLEAAPILGARIWVIAQTLTLRVSRLAGPRGSRQPGEEQAVRSLLGHQSVARLEFTQDQFHRTAMEVRTAVASKMPDSIDGCDSANLQFRSTVTDEFARLRLCPPVCGNHETARLVSSCL